MNLKTVKLGRGKNRCFPEDKLNKDNAAQCSPIQQEQQALESVRQFKLVLEKYLWMGSLKSSS